MTIALEEVLLKYLASQYFQQNTGFNELLGKGIMFNEDEADILQRLLEYPLMRVFEFLTWLGEMEREGVLKPGKDFKTLCEHNPRPWLMTEPYWERLFDLLLTYHYG